MHRLKSMRKLTIIFSFGLLMLAQLTFAAEKVSAPRKSYGGTLVWGTRNRPTIINPVLTSHSVSVSLEELIFNRLVRINPAGNIEADLAESWEISPSGLAYTFHLRQGVKFHDGAECTAEDVKFTYDKIIAPQTASPFNSSLDLVKDSRILDKYTFQIILKEPSVFFIYRLVRGIVPKHILEHEDLKNSVFNFEPIGTGPFRFREWTKDNRIILDANPQYYEGRPYLDRIIVKTYANSGDLWVGLMRQEVDFAEFLEKDDYQVLKDDPTFKAYTFSSDCYYALRYNLNDPILSDKKIREAIAYAVDRKNLIERVASGYGLECVGPFYPGGFGFNPEVKPFPYDPEKARELLSRLGWNDKDGIREKEGRKLELRVLVSSRNELLQRITMVLRQQLQEVGVRVKVMLYDDEKLLMDGKFLRDNQSQAYLGLFVSDLNEWSSEFQRIGKLWSYNNNEIDRLFRVGSSVQDKEQRKVDYQKSHELIYQDQPACFLYFPFVFYAVASKFQNTDTFFNVNSPYYTLKDWYLKNERR